MQTANLPIDWTLRIGDFPKDTPVPPEIRAAEIPATVPGCVHTDLLAQGLIPDPYIGRNELDTHWIGHCDWSYRTQLEVSETLLAHERVELVFDGLDTVATVLVNGRETGHSENMHTRQRFDVKAAVRAGQNEVEVRFASPIRYAEEMERKLGALPFTGAGANPVLPHYMIRKMSCNFGWDWGPQLVTCGIWRPARLEAWSGARLAGVRPLITRADAKRAEIDLRIDLDRTAGGGQTVETTVFDPAGKRVAHAAQPADSGEVRGALALESPELWWPVGYGDQPLYRLEVELRDADGHSLGKREHRMGLRTATLRTEPDPATHDGLGQGETFHLEINGTRIFCKGANWIPDDCFPHRVTPERYRTRIRQALGAHMNMLRVWGGGLYEDDAFYDICDELGILVWQDFLMACACYAEEEPIRSLVEAEARDNVARLCPHPSLVLWNGCNENIWGTFVWGDDWVNVRTEGKRTWGLGYYLELFPRVVAEVDPSRSFWPASPYSGTMDRHPNDNEFGNRHIWDVWNGNGDYRNYLGHFPRFASEFGYQGPATWPTLVRAIPEGERQWLSETSSHHNKQVRGQQRALDRIGDSFETPEKFDDIWYLASVNQCRALTLGCEWFRALSPWCSGALYWQLNDCWPVTSWAAIDGDGRPKLLWHATRRFFRPRMAALLPAAVTPAGTPPGDMAVYLHNDTASQWAGTLRLRRVRIDGTLLEEKRAPFSVEARASFRHLPPSWNGSAGEVLLADIEDADAADRAWWFAGRDRDIAYPEPDFDAILATRGAGQELQVTARSLLRDLCLLIDRLDPHARAEPQLVSLLPGETVTFRIESARSFTQEELASPEILRSVNPFGAGAAGIHS